MKDSNRKLLIYRIAGILSVAWCLSMVLFPGMALASARKGINLWAEAVLPALLPFFICANLMIALEIPRMIGGFFQKPFQYLFGTPGSSAFIFIISITSGYPMGPKLIGDMGRRGEITLDEAKRMLTFCSTSGPLFLLGTVGLGMLNSPYAGVAIAIAHYSGAVLNGILFNLFGKHDRNVKSNIKADFNSLIKRERLLDLFTDSILSALKTLGIICCYLIIFIMATDFIELAGAFDLFSQDYQKGVLKGLLEMTVGCNDLAVSQGISLQAKCVLASFIISFGGFSVFAQSMSVLYGLNISFWYYFVVKCLHGIWSAIIAFLTAPYFLNLPSATVGNFSVQTWTYQAGMLAQLLFSTKMIIIIMFTFALTITVDRWSQRKEKKKNEYSGNSGGI